MTTLRYRIVGLLTCIALFGCSKTREFSIQTVAAPDIPVSEYPARRAAALEALSDGILIVNARPALKDGEQWGFIQYSTFQYFSGLTQVPGAVLALDGPEIESHLFLPPAPAAYGSTVDGLVPEISSATAVQYGFDSVRPWDEFAGWLAARISNGTKLYVDGSRRPEASGTPPGLPPVAGSHTLWRAAIAQRFPSAHIDNAYATIMAMKSVKSPAEIAVLEHNAGLTVESFFAVAARLAPGVSQRQTEAAMIATCLERGGQGPAFWPWTMSGSNANPRHLLGTLYRYDNGNRIAQSGELVRVDIGCASGGYGADVGRTLPVSGQFTAGQAEAWNLLVAGYRAGLDAMADGVTFEAVAAASNAAVRERQANLTTEAGRAAAEVILVGGNTDGIDMWYRHGVGIESGEDVPSVLRTGMVIAYEPGFTIGKDAYYLEDMILITETGHRILSTGLPYTADEIAAAMAR